MSRCEVPLEIKAGEKKGQFEGMGAVFGNTDLEGDVIIEGAFKKMRTTKGGKVRIALYHDLDQLAGQADVQQTKEGLHVKGQLNMNLSYTPDAYELMLDGSLDAMSVGFNILKGGAEFKEDDNNRVVRVISKAELWEVSIVPFGMNPEARIDSVKSGGFPTIRHLERWLKARGLSANDAKAIVSWGFDGLGREGQDHKNKSAEMAEAFKNAIGESLFK